MQTGMFVAELFTMAKTWNDPGASPGEDTNPMWHICMTEYKTVVKTNNGHVRKKEWIIGEYCYVKHNKWNKEKMLSLTIKHGSQF